MSRSPASFAVKRPSGDDDELLTGGIAKSPFSPARRFCVLGWMVKLRIRSFVGARKIGSRISPD